MPKKKDPAAVREVAKRAGPAGCSVPRWRVENVDVATATELLRKSQNPAMVAEMDRFLDHYNYADVARILNENGFKTVDGLPLRSPAVGYSNSVRTQEPHTL